MEGIYDALKSTDDHKIAARSDDISTIQKKDYTLPTGTAKEWLVNTPVVSLFPENRTKIITVEKGDTVATAFTVSNMMRFVFLIPIVVIN